ncbi:B-cell receptor CD22-like [Rhinichthys klamathensis goyatoka]|uniref:B-cell receptor CD22-like n=1 Tax=Rhinichthys klamathensis goyatoka TaxID=3034132 RepID=UPI0024B62608|nr:B-cell receptor CD22-like [Rhinichthys klamathensis goyatoka]
MTTRLRCLLQVCQRCPSQTQSSRLCFLRPPQVSGSSGTLHRVPNLRGWTIGISGILSAPPQCLSFQKCMKRLPEHERHLFLPETVLVPLLPSLPSTAEQLRVTWRSPQWSGLWQCSCVPRSLPPGGEIRTSPPGHVQERHLWLCSSSRYEDRVIQPLLHCTQERRAPVMPMFQIMSFIIIIVSSVFLHTHSADGNTYSAVMPQTVTALTGSCVQIPCTFNISSLEDKRNKAKSIYGIWVKKKPQFADEDGFIAFNSSKNIIRGFSDIQMTGNLSERNCTTVFYNIMMNHSDFYYFRLEMEPNLFRGTFHTNTDDLSKTVRITVKDSPQPPELKPTDLKPVMETTTVSLSCSAEAPCPKQPPTLSWSYIPESAHITTQLQEKPDKTQSVFSHMTFKASYMDNRKNISCTATYPRKSSKDSTVETTVMLRVLFSPKETRITIDPSASVSVNTSVTLTCKSKGSPSREMNYTWYKRGQEMAIAQGKQITFNGTQNNAGWYSCTAQNEHGKQSSAEIQLTVEEQDGHLMPLIVGCVGGIVAVLTLSALGFCARRKIFNEPSANEKNRSGQVKITDVDYIKTASYITTNEMSDDETLIIYYEKTDISEQQNFCITETLFKHDEYTEIEYRVP